MFPNSNTRHFQRGLDRAAARAGRESIRLKHRRHDREQHFIKTRTNLGCDDDTKSPMKSDSMDEHIASISKHCSPSIQLLGLKSIRKLVTVNRDTAINSIISNEVVPQIINYMYSNDFNLVLESSLIMTNLTSTTVITNTLVNNGAINALGNILFNNNFANNLNLMAISFECLGNIIANKKQFADNLINTGIFNRVINVLATLDITSNNIGLYQNAFYLIYHAIQPTAKQLTIEILESKFQHLLELIHKLLLNAQNKLIVSHLLYCLIGLSNNDKLIDYIVNYRNNVILNICMELLKNEMKNYKISKCDRILSQCVCFIENVLQFTGPLKRQLIRSLLNISEYVVERKTLIKKIIYCSRHDTKHIRMEAIDFIYNVLDEAKPTLKQFMVDNGAIDALCATLNPIYSLNDAQVFKIAQSLQLFLETFHNEKYTNSYARKIEECKGFDYLEERFSTQNLSQKTSNFVVELLGSYLAATDEIKPEIHETNVTNEINEISEYIATTGVYNTNTNKFKFGSTNIDNTNQFDF